MKSQAYNIVLLPPSKYFQETIRLSKHLSKNFKSKFIVDGAKIYPHTTLYQVEIPESTRARFLQVVNEIFKNQKTIKTYTNGYASAATFIFLNLKRTTDLANIHKKIIQQINPLRKGLIVSKIGKDWKVVPKEFGTDLKRFGSLGVLKNYRPHLTITRLGSTNDVKGAIEFLPQLENEPVLFDRAALGKLGNHGTVIKILKTYKLR